MSPASATCVANLWFRLRVYDAASRILVGLMANEKLTPENEEEMLAKSVRLAFELAITTDKVMALSVNQGKTISD